jgi:hypothetical protein
LGTSPPSNPESAWQVEAIQFEETIDDSATHEAVNHLRHLKPDQQTSWLPLWSHCGGDGVIAAEVYPNDR